MERTTRDVPVRELVMVPAIITLAVTLLRLAGELLDWSPFWFSKAAGGGGSPIGIVWLVPVFAIWFALKLVHLDLAPAKAWRPLGIALLAFVIIPITGFVVNALKLPFTLQLAAYAVASIPAVWLSMRAWPELGKVLLAYGLAARIPVVLVMLAAMLGEWGTHYDAPAPGMPPSSVMIQFVSIGLIPQMTIWIWFTVVAGTIFGALALAVARARRPAAV